MIPAMMSHKSNAWVLYLMLLFTYWHIRLHIKIFKKWFGP